MTKLGKNLTDRSNITRFLTQAEPVLNEPGLKNPQASKIKNSIFLSLKMNRFQNKPQASKMTQIYPNELSVLHLQKNINCQPSCIFFLKREIFLLGTYEEGVIPAVKVYD